MTTFIVMFAGIMFIEYTLILWFQAFNSLLR
jgi:hypothetical protein